MDLQHILNMLQYIPDDVWENVVTIALTSPALLAVRKKFKIDSNTIMFALVTFLPLVVSFGQYFASSHPSNPVVIYLISAAMSHAAQSVYYFIVKPILRAYAKRHGKTADELIDEAKRAALPQMTTPAVPASVVTAQVIDDFTH